MKKPEIPADPEAQVRSLLQDLEAALESTTRRAAKWRGWQALCQAGTFGETILPYATTALSEFEAAHALDEHDGDVLHHLAISYHALAWDSELAGDFGVADHAWQQALFYWKSLQACGDFWQALIAKGSSLKGFDPQTIESFRRNLFTYILEIHVEFIRFYYGQNETALAARHISLIQHARISPATRKQLDSLVYQALSEFIPNLLADGHYEDALKRLDDCLQLIPNHAPLLTTYVEITQEWVQQLPEDCEPRLLEEINQRASGHWDTLHDSDASSIHLLFDLASLLGERFWRQAENLVRRRLESDPSQQLPFFGSEEERSYQYAVAWMKKTLATASETTWIECNLSLCQGRLALLTGLYTTTWEDSNRAFEEGIQHFQKVMDLVPQENGPSQALSQILYVRALVAIQNHRLPPENFRTDLLKAQQLNPENDELKQFVEGLGMTPSDQS